MAGVRETSFILLKGIFEESKGNCQEIVRSSVVSQKLGLDPELARGALVYLIGRGLVHDTREVAQLPAVFITANGIDAVENALARPGIPTQHFPAVQNIINISTFNGGAIQQGTSHSKQVVTHTVGLAGVDLQKLAVELATLRNAVLPHASTAEHFAAIGRLSEAQIAAEEKDVSKVEQALSSIGQAGRWLLSAGEKISVGLATSALRTYFGL